MKLLKCCIQYASCPQRGLITEGLSVRKSWLCYFGIPWWLRCKESACGAGDSGSIPGSGRSLEKEMATHSSILAWRVPWTEELGRLQFMGSQRVGCSWVTNSHFFCWKHSHQVGDNVLFSWKGKMRPSVTESIHTLFQSASHPYPKTASFSNFSYSID